MYILKSNGSDSYIIIIHYLPIISPTPSLTSHLWFPLCSYPLLLFNFIPTITLSFTIFFLPLMLPTLLSLLYLVFSFTSLFHKSIIFSFFLSLCVVIFLYRPPFLFWSIWSIDICTNITLFISCYFPPPPPLLSLSLSLFLILSHLSISPSILPLIPFIKHLLTQPFTTKLNNNTNIKYNKSFISVIAHRHALFMFSDISFLTFFFLPIAAYIHKVSLINFVHRGITSKNKNTGITTRQIVLFLSTQTGSS